MKLSIVSPIYLAENTVFELVNRLHKSLSIITNDYEIILVEDGSPDNSWNKIKQICSYDSKTLGIQLSRNFGQHYAITAGLEASSGDWIVVMDCDLQDRPEEIPLLFEKTNEGVEIIYACREIRKDNFFKKISSKVFYKTFGYLTDSKQDESIANFGIYHRKAIQAVLEMNDYVRFFPIMIQWVGFNSTKVNISHGERKIGKSTYSWKKLIQLAFDNIVSFSDKPLRVAIKLGFIISLLSFVAGLYYLWKYFNGKIEVLGFTSIIISICFFSGLNMSILGIVGIYLGKVFDKVKGRPTYIVSNKINVSK